MSWNCTRNKLGTTFHVLKMAFICLDCTKTFSFRIKLSNINMDEIALLHDSINVAAMVMEYLFWNLLVCNKSREPS